MTNEISLDIGAQWISQLGGEGVLPNSYCSTPAMALGHFRFRSLVDEVEAPPLPFHYISVTLGSPLRIDANVGGKRVNVRMRRGLSMIMAADRYNSWRWDGPTEEALIFLKPDYLNMMARQAGVSATDISDRFVFEDTALRKTILTIVHELSSQNQSSQLFFEMAAQALALHLLRKHCDPALVGSGAMLTAAQLRRVVELVHDCIHDDLDLAALADAASVSRFHFVRSFKVTTGLPPHKWLIVQKMNRAKQLLHDTKLSMLEIAAAVGFESQSHFGHAFKAQFGQTPRDWRSRPSRDS